MIDSGWSESRHEGPGHSPADCRCQLPPAAEHGAVINTHGDAWSPPHHPPAMGSAPVPGSTVASAQKHRQVWPKLHGQIKLSPRLAQGNAACRARVGYIPTTALGCSWHSPWLRGTRSPETNSTCARSRQRQKGSRGSRWVRWSAGDNQPETFTPAVTVKHSARLAAIIFCKGLFYI